MLPRVEPQPIKVAACQVSLHVGEMAQNRATAADAVTRAAALGAKIVVLPELTPSGYIFRHAAEARSLSEPPDGPTAAQWQELAARHDIVIVGGFSELGADDLLYNSAMLVDPSGVRAVYRKAHLWDAEADFFTPGSEPPPVVKTSYGAISMLICYDVEFPEWVRLPALAGAELLAVPTNWPAQPVPAGERSILTANVQVQAFANRMFIAAACRCGAERGVGWTGGSVIAGHDGYPLAGPASTASPAGPASTAGSAGTAGNSDSAGTAQPELLVADCELSLARNKATGPRNDAHADRRPAMYR